MESSTDSIDNPRKLIDLQERYGLSDECVGKLATLLELLEVDEHASTTVKSRTAAIDTHIADSLAALNVEELQQAKTVVDIGSGAGFPGLPLAIACGKSKYELLEASARKLNFARRLLDRLDLENVGLLAERAELWAKSGGACMYQIALSRALADLPTVLEYSAPLLEHRGISVAWKGRRNKDEEIQALRAAEALGMELMDVLAVDPYPGSRNRHLHIYRKVRSTPERYPRRAGMAKKYPLGKE